MHAAVRITAAIAGAVVALATGPASAAAALPAGFPDTSFGAGGLAQAPFGAAARAAALALGPDGTFTVAGDVRGSAGEAALVARFTSAGALDTTFAGAGSRVDRFGAGTGAGAAQRANAVVVAPDGGAIVAGVAGDALMLARYLPDGTLDGLFGAGGVVLRELPSGAEMPAGAGLSAIALTPDGQIVVAGSTGVAPRDRNDYEAEPGEQVVVGRLSSRGVPDPSFGNGGFTTLQLGARSARRPGRSRAAALALMPDGTVVVAGRASGPNGADRALLARLDGAGRLDTSFGRAGRSLAQLGRASAARPASSALHALAARADGTLLVAGRATDVAGNGQVVLARFTAGGALDASFGRAGVLRTQASAATKDRPIESLARAIAPTADGNILITGSTAIGGAFTLRATASGRLDCAYGTLGEGAGLHQTIPRPGDPASDGAFGVLAQPDGHYVGAGRLPGGGLLLGRVLGGPGVRQPPARRPQLRSLGARYLGKGRGVVYGAFLSKCSTANVRFVASPATRRAGDRPVITRYARVSGADGWQVICARLSGLRAGRTYRVRIDARKNHAPGDRKLRLRAVPTGRKALPQEGCA